MDIKELLLKSEELPILDDVCFQVPIHPRFLDGSTKISDGLAKRAFQEARKSWENELKVSFPRGWENVYQTNEDGLVTGFQISRDQGGCLYFNMDDSGCRDFGERYIRFSPEKRFEYQSSTGIIYAYAGDNIDDYYGALFLRDWAMFYMNEAIRNAF